MECSSCLKPYDDAHHIPKILIKCGHTICSICIDTQIKETREEAEVAIMDEAKCPQCGAHFPLSIASREYPVNLALLALVK